MAYGTVNVDAMTTSDGYTSAGTYGFKNRIINGAMVIDQRNAGASLSSPSAYTVDRWFFGKGASTATYTVQQSSTAPTGFRNSLAINVSSGVSIATGQYSNLSQAVEGYNTADLMWGTANAQSVTLSFWVRSSLTGTFGVGFRNNAGDRNYIASYTINSANTFEYKTITIAGDTSGTWDTTNNIGVQVNWDMGVGTTYSSSGGSWTSSNVLGLTGGVKVLANTGASWYLTGVQLEKGSTATSFDYRPYQTELALAQRYYAKFSSLSGTVVGFGSGVSTATTSGAIFVKYPVRMRSAPTITQSNTALYDAGSVVAVTSIGSNYYGDETLFANINVASGLTLGRGCIWCGNSSATAYIDLSSEL